MTSLAKSFGLAGALVAGVATFASNVGADQRSNVVRERQASVTELSADASAVTYWTRAPDGWHVVTTVDTIIGRDGDSEKHAVVRFSSVLLPGQSQQISVPFALGAPQPRLRIRRLGEEIEVARVPGSPER